MKQLCSIYSLGARAISKRVLAGKNVEMLIIPEMALAPKPYMLLSWLRVSCIFRDVNQFCSIYSMEARSISVRSKPILFGFLSKCGP